MLAGYRHGGHILLTDFPTVQGIPIPLLSGGGLGQWLVNTVGIKSGWLCVNVFDAGLGVIAVSTASENLIRAMAAELPMSAWTAFTTFGVGAGEIHVGVTAQNPLVVFAGVENIAAGILSAADKLKAYSAILQIDPLLFLGAGLLSTAVGFTVSRALLGQDTTTSIKTGLQNGLVGALLAASTGAGVGVMLGLAAYAYGKALAQRKTAKFSRESFIMLEQAIFEANPDVEKMTVLSREQLFTLDDRPLALPEPRMLPEFDPAEYGFAHCEEELVAQVFKSLPPPQLFPSSSVFPPVGDENMFPG